MQPRKPKSAPLPLNGCVHQDHKHAPFCFKLVSAPGKTLCPFHELLAAEKERQRSAAAKMRRVPAELTEEDKMCGGPPVMSKDERLQRQEEWELRDAKPEIESGPACTRALPADATGAGERPIAGTADADPAGAEDESLHAELAPLDRDKCNSGDSESVLRGPRPSAPADDPAWVSDEHLETDLRLESRLQKERADRAHYGAGSNRSCK